MSAAARGENAPAPFSSVELKGGLEGVIVPEARAPEFGMLQGRNKPPSEYWTPTAEQVVELESKLSDYLKSTAPARAPELWKKLDQYKRQYVGIVVEGRRLIYANFICDGVIKESFRDWKSRPIQVDDGGDCFFEVDYEPATGQFSELMVHGEA